MIFQKTDTNNDHKISSAEFIQHMKLSMGISAGEWDVVFDELDADKNGALSHSEFWAKMAIKNSPNLMDALDKFEVSITNNPLWGRFLNVRPVELLSIQKADADNDQKISRAEFIAHMEKQ